MVLHNFYPNIGWVDLPIILFCLPILGLSLQRPLSQGTVACLHHRLHCQLAFSVARLIGGPGWRSEGRRKKLKSFFPCSFCALVLLRVWHEFLPIPMLSKPWAPWVPVLNTDDLGYPKHLINAHLGLHPLLILLAPLQGITLLKCICWALTNMGCG